MRPTVPSFSSIARPLLLLTFVLLVVGCGTVHQTHWVQGPFMEEPDLKGFNYGKVYLAPDAADAIRGKTLMVRVLDPGQTLDPEACHLTGPMDWDAFRKDFENTLADILWRSRVFKDVGAAADPYPIVHPDLTLTVAVTEYDEGSAFLRYFPGFGAGATRVQWEGELDAMPARGATDEAKPRRVFAWADARLHPGGPYLGISLKPYYGKRLIAEDLSFGVDQLVGDLRRLTGTKEDPLRFVPHPQSGEDRIE